MKKGWIIASLFSIAAITVSILEYRIKVPPSFTVTNIDPKTKQISFIFDGIKAQYPHNGGAERIKGRAGWYLSWIADTVNKEIRFYINRNDYAKEIQVVYLGDDIQAKTQIIND